MNNTVKILFTAVLLLFLHQLAIYGQMDNHYGYRPKMLVYDNLKNKEVLKHFNERFDELEHLFGNAKVIKSPYAAARDMSDYNTILDSLYKSRNTEDVKSLLQNTGLEVTGQVYGRLDNSFHISDEDDVSSYKAKAQAEIGWDFINSKFYQKNAKTNQIFYGNEVDRLQQYKKQNENIFDDRLDKITEIYNYYLAVVMSHRLKNLDILNEASQLMLEQDRIASDETMEVMNEKIDLEYQLSQTYGPENLDKQPLYIMKPTILVVDTLALMNIANDNMSSKIITANQKVLENRKLLTNYLSTTRLTPFFRVSSYWTSKDRLSNNLDLGVRFTIPLWNQTKPKQQSLDTQSALLELQRTTDNQQLRSICVQQLALINKMNQSVNVEAMHIRQIKKYVAMRKNAYLKNANGYNYISRMEEYNQLLKAMERLCHLMLNRQVALINIEKALGSDITPLTREIDL
jgi:hypothetical protein